MYQIQKYHPIFFTTLELKVKERQRRMRMLAELRSKKMFHCVGGWDYMVIRGTYVAVISAKQHDGLRNT